MTDLSGIQTAVGGAAQDAAEGWLAELLGPLQHDRLLRLHTPLGPQVLLAERVRITEGLTPGEAGSSPFAMELLALSTRADLRAPDLLGQPVLLELLTAHSRTTLRPFHGHVLAFELLGADGGYARYRLQIGSWFDFLHWRRNAWVYQGLTVQGITDAVLGRYAGQGQLQPPWRWALADATVYPQLSTLTQYDETDAAFLQRLWAANGLFCWVEHEGQPADVAGFGRHILVIADHNGAFTPNAQPRMRYTQPGATLREDSITRWHGHRRMGVSQLQMASFDYRTLTQPAGMAQADTGHAQAIDLSHVDQPGAYAFETPQEAQRMVTVQQQALDARRKQFAGEGTVRTLAPATTLVLCDHPEHDRDRLQAGDEAATFVVLSVTHEARNNLRADALAGLQHLLGPNGLSAAATQGNDSSQPLYQARFLAQRANVPVRAPIHDEAGRLLHPRPTVWGTQTALVVGLDAPVHTDRDGRIKVQFHWQRGAASSHRLTAGEAASDGDNAPASDASGTWVRVAQGWAGANWGASFLPRLGQEVLVAFVEGDIDRPIVVGALYNGQGESDAQGNVVGGGAAGATGNAPAWFPGAARAGDLEGHAHTATLSGFKSQSLETSQTGSGGHNQLVFDDTPGQGRVLAHTTQDQTWLQIGHLLQQQDNQRLARRGHGLELHTQAWGAVRAGSGLHLSTHGRAAGTTSGQGQPMQTREAQQQLQAHAELVKALSANAQTHRAKLPNEAEPDQLPAQQALQATLKSLRAQRADHGGTPPDDPALEADEAVGDASAGTPRPPPIAGGRGSIPVTDRPDLVLGAAADIASLTPAHQLLAAGGSTSLTAGQDTQLLAQRHAAWAVKDGISLFTRGEAKDGQRPVRDTGLKLHAASGNVHTEAQRGAFTLTAQQAIDLQSTGADIVITAPNRIVLNGGGGYVKLEGANIEIGTSGNASFLASMKELTGGGSASTPGMSFSEAALSMPKHPLQVILVNADGEMPNAEELTLRDGAGVEHNVMAAGGVAKISDFKRGLSKSSQPKRKD
jgi:type VI secretion system secreted protein VgrG